MPQDDPLAQALLAVGDRWSASILHEIGRGIGRFELLREALTIAPSTLSRRLRALTDAGLIEMVPYHTRPARHEYRATTAGETLFPILVALGEWGRKHNGDDRLHRWVNAVTGAPIEPALTLQPVAATSPVHDNEAWDWPPPPSDGATR